MKKAIILSVLVFVLVLLASWIWFEQQTPSNEQNLVIARSPEATVAISPVSRASERVTKKPFGIYITQKNSPVQPEKFTGYHTGADFEIFADELKTNVSVKAICSGVLKLKQWASGYGGVVVQSCELASQPVTVIYGHIKLSSISAKVGEKLEVGKILGILGNAYSTETDGERKHLHLGIHKGTAINIRGYVSAKSALSGWLNPCDFVCGK